MEAKENMTSGVTIVRGEAPSNYHVASRAEAPSNYHVAHRAEVQSNYHVAPRAEASGQVTVSPVMALTPASVGMGGVMEKKKRGRPRKYGPDGTVTRPYSPMPASSSAPSSASKLKFSSGKRGRGRPIGPESDQGLRVNMENLGEGAAHTDGAHFTPHVITVNTGEDVTAKIISFCQQGPRAICILSANGVISNATLRQSDSSGGTLTYEGRFEIVNLCGSFTPSERDGARYRAGGLSVSLSSPNGQVVGGCIAGLMVAAAPVQIVVGSFLPSNLLEQKPKKNRARPVQFPTIAAPGAAIEDDRIGLEQNNSDAMMPNATSSPFQRDNWPSTYTTMHNPRISTTDINISLPGGMQ